ncbi:MAG: hypothetical protein K6F48_03695 [Paludibacteraceae bacterium]|nr:hypothetical protein [Paludibacteraceae bacterium]
MCVSWTVTGKVSDVIRTEESNKPKLHFDYDAMGQRISKTVTNKNVTTGDKFVTTYYVRDPQGNVMAVYEHKHGDSDNGTFTLAEQHLYGAGRLGMRKRDLALNTGNANESPATYYELTNHLGNVMAVISDEASTAAEPTVVSLTDYYPYGMTEPGRSWNAGAEGYRYGFNTQENVPELGDGHTTALYWEYDGRLGKRWNLDPISKEYESNYSVLGNSPLYAIDVYGADSTLFGENGMILCQISNDNGATNVWFELKTTLKTEQMYGHINYKDSSMKGWTNPISPEDRDAAIRSATNYRDEKLLSFGFRPEHLRSMQNNIRRDAFVEIPNQVYGDVSLNHLSSRESEYPDGDREFGWDMIRENGGKNFSLYRTIVGPKMDPKSGTYVSVDYRRNHAHPAGEFWAQPPSSTDIRNTTEGVIRYVWALGNRTLYIFDNTGVLATIPFSFYKKINNNKYDW